MTSKHAHGPHVLYITFDWDCTYGRRSAALVLQFDGRVGGLVLSSHCTQGKCVLSDKSVEIVGRENEVKPFISYHRKDKFFSVVQTCNLGSIPVQKWNFAKTSPNLMFAELSQGHIRVNFIFLKESEVVKKMACNFPSLCSLPSS